MFSTLGDVQKFGFQLTGQFPNGLILRSDAIDERVREHVQAQQVRAQSVRIDNPAAPLIKRVDEFQ